MGEIAMADVSVYEDYFYFVFFCCACVFKTINNPLFHLNVSYRIKIFLFLFQWKCQNFAFSDPQEKAFSHIWLNIFCIKYWDTNNA